MVSQGSRREEVHGDTKSSATFRRGLAKLEGKTRAARVVNDAASSNEKLIMQVVERVLVTAISDVSANVRLQIVKEFY